MQVSVRDNNVEQALRALKKKLQREGVFREALRQESTRTGRSRAPGEETRAEKASA
jgi:small subunit ribosomal protein S21